MGKGVKGTSEQIFFFYVFYVIACDLKISIDKVNWYYMYMIKHQKLKWISV